MVEFYARVSDESKYYRFFSPMPKLSERDVRRFTHVDHRDRVALVMLLGGQMIAVGRFDVVRPREAEVAFLVEDQHQGRGIGQLLLEHLAQAGRERGVERFVAEVLPDNNRMIQTFRDAGYRVASGYADGVITLEFPIDPTDTAIGVMHDREHVAESASIHRFFHPASVAIIGASRRQDTIGQLLVRNLVTADFTGRVYVVNPSADRGQRDAGVQVGQRDPRRRRRRDRGRAGRGGDRRRARLRGQGRARPDRHLVRLRRDRRRGPAAAAAPGRPVPVLRPAPDRAQLPRRHQHRPRVSRSTPPSRR